MCGNFSVLAAGFSRPQVVRVRRREGGREGERRGSEGGRERIKAWKSHAPLDVTCIQYSSIPLLSYLFH